LNLPAYLKGPDEEKTIGKAENKKEDPGTIK
jgi:hypothetical protein